MRINLTNLGLKFRATVCNSSNAAFKLGCRSPEDRSFCRKIISIKNNNAHIKLRDVRISKEQEMVLNKKIDKFTSQEYKLSMLNLLKNQQLVKKPSNSG